MPSWRWRSTRRSTRSSSWSASTTRSREYRFRHALVQEAAYDELLPSERRPSTAPTPGRSRRDRRAVVRRRPAGSSSWPTTGPRRTTRRARWRPRSRPATRRGPSTPMPTRRASTSGRSSCGTSCRSPIDRPTATCGPVRRGERRGDARRRRVPGGQPRPAGDRARRWRTRRRRAIARDVPGHARCCGIAAWLAGDTATSIRLLEEAVELLDGTPPPSTGQARVLSWPRREPHAGRPVERIDPVRGRAIESARTIGDRAIESRATNTLGVDRATLGNIVGRHRPAARVAGDRRASRRPDRDPARPREPGHAARDGRIGRGGPRGIAGRGRGQPALRQRSRLRDLPRRQYRLDAHRARTLRRRGRAARAARGARAPGRDHDPRPRRADPSGCADRRPGGGPDTTSRSPGERRPASRTPSSSSTSTRSGPRSRCGSGDPATALAIARDGLRPRSPRWTTRSSSASSPSRPSVRPRISRSGPGPARDPADAGLAVAGRPRHHRALPRVDRRLTDLDDLARTRSAGGWQLCEAELARAIGADDAGALGGGPSGPHGPARAVPRGLRPVADGRGARRGRRYRRRGDRPLREGHALAMRIGAALARRPRSRVSAGVCGSTSRRRRRPLCAAASQADAAAALPMRPARSDAPADPFGLTTREREVLALVAEGYTNRRIADDAVHQREHGRRPRLAHPRQARRRDAHRGGGGRGEARAGPDTVARR